MSNTCVGVLLAMYSCTFCACSTHRGQKMVLDPPTAKATGSCDLLEVGSGKETQMLWNYSMYS